jgi:hypothetical protein
MPDGIYVNTPSTAPVYHYYTVDIVTNEVLAQIPFEDVAYERKIKEPGSFEGAITISSQTEDLDLYNSTMPGKTAIYVTRNGECVWGGIIWGRTYDLGGRALAISASEFSSYLQKRHIWKTYSYKFEAEILKTTKGGAAKVTLKNNKMRIPLKKTDDSGNPTKVYVSFAESNLVKYTGYYSVASASADPTQTTIYLSIPKLPAESAAYQNISISVKVDTYDYVREMLNDVLSDFSNTNFANEDVAPGVKVPVKVLQRAVSNNIVTLDTDGPHGLVEGQRVDVYNIDRTLTGKHTISEVPTTTQIKYEIPVLNITHVSRDENVATVYANIASGQVIQFEVGHEVIVAANITAYNNSGNPVTITEVTDKTISYSNTGSNQGKVAATGNITVETLTTASTNPVNVRVYSREVTSTGPKRVEYVKRKSGYVYVYTTAPHGFKKADKVKVSFADISNYKTLNNDDVPVSVLSAESKMFKYYQPDYTASSKNITANGGNKVKMADPSKHTVVLATPVKKLKLNTAGAHAWKVGDLVNVRGVDRIDWQRRIYDGFQKVVDLDTTEDELSADVLTVTDYMVTSGTTATLWTNRTHNIQAGDMVKVYNYTSGLTYLNGTFKVTDVFDPDSAASGESWIRFKLATRRTNVAKTANTSGRVAPYGASWFTYNMPEDGATREPDDTISVVKAGFTSHNGIVVLITDKRHNCTVGDRILVSIGSSTFDGYHTVAQANADGLSYFLPAAAGKSPPKSVPLGSAKGNFKRYRTKVGYIPTLTVPIDRLGRYSNVATIYAKDHNFAANDVITVEIDGATYESFENSNTTITITSVTDDTFTYASTGSDVGVKVVTAASITSKVATLTSASHGFAVGQKVTVSKINGFFNGTHTITDVTTNTFKYAVTATNRSSTGLSGQAVSTINVAENTHFAYIDYSNIERTLQVTNLSSASNVVTMTSEGHGFIAGDYVITFIKGKTYKKFRNNNQAVRISSVTEDTFTYTSLTGYETGNVSSVAVEGYVVFAPQVEKTPVIISRTYGEFPGNADMGGLDFSSEDYSSTQYPNDLVRGSDLLSVYEHLERYTSNKNGFDYRIDCSLVSGAGNKKVFKRTFVLIPRTPETLTEYLDSMPDGKLSVGTYAPPSAFGADKLVFEYPGNIQNVSFSENAGNSATRVFVVGNNSDLGGSSSARYSASSETELLNAGWPILDRVEKVEWPLKGVNVINTDNWGNYDSEADMQLTAERFLRETRPPSGDFIITVNGSLTPEIGSFDPGDWCSIVVRDAFVAQRMASNLEPRSDVIVRKIDGIRVSVPNSPAFPEIIDLTLVTEWQVDTVGK